MSDLLRLRVQTLLDDHVMLAVDEIDLSIPVGVCTQADSMCVRIVHRDGEGRKLCLWGGGGSVHVHVELGKPTRTVFRSASIPGIMQAIGDYLTAVCCDGPTVNPRQAVKLYVAAVHNRLVLVQAGAMRPEWADSVCACSTTGVICNVWSDTALTLGTAGESHYMLHMGTADRAQQAARDIGERFRRWQAVGETKNAAKVARIEDANGVLTVTFSKE